MDWLGQQGFKINRASVYSHAQHGPRGVVVSPVARQAPAQSGDLLDLVIEAGKQAVAADPSIVSLKNALDAQRIKDMRKEHSDDLRLELARMVMAGKVQAPMLLPEPALEGEFTQIE